MLKTNRITQAPGVYFYKTNKLEIEFETDISNNWCIDGEKLDENPKKYVIEIDKDLKIMMPKKNIETLFVKKWYNFKKENK